MTKRKEVYAAIDSEREYQEGVWGATLSGNREPDTSKGESGGDRTIDEFSLYIIGYASDLQREASHFATTTEKLDIIRKISGLGVACMEQHGAPHRVTPEKLPQANLKRRYGSRR